MQDTRQRYLRRSLWHQGVKVTYKCLHLIGKPFREVGILSSTISMNWCCLCCCLFSRTHGLHVRALRFYVTGTCSYRESTSCLPRLMQSGCFFFVFSTPSWWSTFSWHLVNRTCALPQAWSFGRTFEETSWRWSTKGTVSLTWVRSRCTGGPLTHWPYHSWWSSSWCLLLELLSWSGHQVE